jgi:hypothetical protein
LEAQKPSSYGVIKAQVAGMERLSAKNFNGLLSGQRQPLHAGGKAFPIGRISQQGVADVAQMDPNLVGAAGLEPAFDEGGLAWLRKAAYGFVMCGGTAALPRYGDLAPIGDRTAKRCIDHSATGFWPSPDEGLVDAFEPAIAAVGGEQRGETLVCTVGFGNDKEAGCVLVEPMNDAGTADAANA